MTEPPQWIIDILIILIPTIAGALTSGFSLHHWQVKKEKFELEKQKYELRRKILDDYQKSMAAKIVLSFNFTDKIHMHYTKPKLVSKDKTIEYYSFIPDEEDKKPKKQFLTEKKEFDKEDHRLNYEVWDFFATMSVYFDSEELISKYNQLADKQFSYKEMSNLLVLADNTKDFIEILNILEEYKADLREMGAEFADLLSDESLKMYPR